MLVVGAVAVIAGLAFGVGTAKATIFSVAISKGCDGPAYVGDPYECNSSLQNLDPQGNSYIVHSLVDRVTGSGGTTSYNLFALHIPLVFVNHNNATSVSCTNGSGTGTKVDPFIPTSTTVCTLPGDLTLAKQGGELDVGDDFKGDFSTYTVLPGDFPGGVTDQVEYDITNSCNVVTTSCNSTTVNPETASGSADVMQRLSKAATTILDAGDKAVTTVAVGSIVHDSGTVSEDTASEIPPPISAGPVPTGTVTINFFHSGDCSGTIADTGTATLDGSGNFDATSMPETVSTPGMYSFHATYGGDGTYQPSLVSGCEPLQVVDANISLSPLTATNAAGTSHTVTCTIKQNLGDGNGFVAAPNGTECDWSITAGPNSGKSGSCTTSGGTGTCQFTYSDTGGAGTDTIHATTTFSVSGVSLTRSTLPSGTDSHGDGTDVAKTWVDANISLSPLTAANAVGTSHTVTCTIKQNTGSGFVAAPDGTECDWSITAGPNSGKSGSCTTSGGTGTCQFTYSDTGGVGTDTIHATTTFSVAGLSLTRSTLASGTDSHGDGTDVAKSWVDANISLSPLTKTNQVGTSHTVTCTIKQNLGDGNGFVAAPNGTVCNWSITAGPNSGKSGSCTTSGGTGTCQFTYSDTGGAGTDTIHATTTFSVSGVSLTRSTLASGTDSSGDGTDVAKTWVDANISLSPLTATNLAGTSHTVTCTIKQNTGSGFVAAPDGTECDWSITAGPNSGKSGSCTTSGGTGTCQFTYSDTGGAGTDTIHATTTFSVAGLSLTRSTLASGTDSSGDGTDVAKSWVDANIALSPLTKANQVGTSHTVTCTIKQNTGSGFVAAPDGTECDWSITAGPNSGKSGSCTTGGGTGTCTFTYSDTGGAGTDTIHATTTFTVAGLSLTRSTLASGTDSHGDGTDVAKTWVDANIALSPGSANNPAGTSHTVTCTIKQNTGSGFVAAPDGTVCNWSITAGPNSGKSGTCSTSGGTGTCTFTYSDTGGAGTDTIHATTTFSVAGLSLTRSTLASGTDSSGDGTDVTKTWLDDTITTKVLAGSTDVTGSTTITPGTVVHDEATVGKASGTPSGAPAPSGTVTFTLYNGTGCNGSVVSTDPNEPLTAGVADSVTFTTPSTGGPFSYLAHYNGDSNYPGKNASCEPFTVQAPNFGPALTPGFWKNHQAATTALLPITLGNYHVTTFALALGVFNAMKCSSPIDCLAGHLLAAKLDLKGGSNPSILPVIAQADALLVAVNYGGPGINTANAAQNALALQLEVLIDAYTNQ
jgi:hypothetical protein